MFTPRKIATVSGIIGSLAAFCVGAGHAYADGSRGDCNTTLRAAPSACTRARTRRDKDGTHVLRQAQDCSTSDRPRVVFPDDRLTDEGSNDVGQVVECNNTAKLPKGFKKPHIEF